MLIWTVNVWMIRGKPRCAQLTDDDDEDACHYLEGQGEGDECQHGYVVPEEGRRASSLSLLSKFVNNKWNADVCSESHASAAFRTGIQLPARWRSSCVWRSPGRAPRPACPRPLSSLWRTGSCSDLGLNPPENETQIFKSINYLLCTFMSILA